MFEILEDRQGDVLVLNLKGELMGGDEAKDFQDRIYRAIEEEDEKIVVRLDGVSWMNSSGLGMLMGALTTLRSSGGDLKLAHVPERVHRPIVVTKLDRVLAMYDTVADAVAGFAEEG